MTLIKVTEQHIEQGVEGNTERCAVALAIKDVIKPELTPHVGEKSIRLYLKEGDVFFEHIPPHVRKFMEKLEDAKLNNTANPKPIMFELDIPEEYVHEH